MFYRRAKTTGRAGDQVHCFHFVNTCTICKPLMPSPLLQQLVEYYQVHSLKEGFSSLDTNLKYAYKEIPSTTDPSRRPRTAVEGWWLFLTWNGLLTLSCSVILIFKNNPKPLC